MGTIGGGGYVGYLIPGCAHAVRAEFGNISLHERPVLAGRTAGKLDEERPYMAIIHL
jgi:hypothetical protein